MRSPHLVILALPVLLAPAPSFAADQADPRCDAPHELIEDEPRMPALAQQLKDKKPITIVVIGGASTAGTAPDNAYPRFLEIALRRHRPDTTINVINRGVAGQTTEQMANRFAKDIYGYQPNLVIWETGTVDAVRSEEVNAFVEALNNGIAALQEHKTEIMLMDMQYNPSTVSVINFQPYLDALHQTATLQDVYMFPRFDIMRYWSEAGAFDFINVPRERRPVLAREFYECLGERLADAVEFAAR